MLNSFLAQRWQVRTGRALARFGLLRLIPTRTYSRALRTGDEVVPAAALDAAKAVLAAAALEGDARLPTGIIQRRAQRVLRELG